MKLLTTIGAVMLVLGFLANAVDAFPLADLGGTTPVDEDTPFSADIAEETAGKVGTMYTTIIDDLVSFADNPDLALAESRRDAMTAYAGDLADRYQVFANDMQLRLDDLQAEAEQTTSQ